MSSLPQLIDEHFPQDKINFVTEKCPDCGSDVSYEMGAGNPVCKNNDCRRIILYDSWF